MIKLKQTTIILLVTLALATLVIGLLAYFSLRLTSQTRALEREVDQLTLDQTRYSQQSQLWESNSSAFQDWSGLLPVTEGEVAVLAATLEQLALSHELSIVLNFDDFPGIVEVLGKQHYGLGLDVDLQGSFQNLIGFTYELGKLPYFYRIDKLTLTQNEAGNGVKANFQGVLFMNQTPQ